MKFKVKPYPSNKYELAGLLIRESSLALIAEQLKITQINLNRHHVFPIPGNTPNSLWGAFVPLKDVKKIVEIGKNHLYQAVENTLFIPENSTIFPQITSAELKQLFPTNQYFFHPEIGFAELINPINWSELIEVPDPIESKTVAPATGVQIPMTIKTFHIKKAPPEKILENLASKSFPKKEKLDNEPLGFFEKIKLGMLRGLFKKPEKKAGKNSEGTAPPTGLLKLLIPFIGLLGVTGMVNKLNVDFEELEKRNQKNMDKLMDMFKENPEEALKYAIPLDSNNSTRGGREGQFDLSKRWFDFNLFGNQRHAGDISSAYNIIPSDHYHTLENQYRQTAEALKKKGDYQKAAFIYLKLLKNYYAAASTLAEGNYHNEAASIYEKFAQDKNMAARCYENGNMLEKAIELYKDLGEDEKVGDLYISLNQRKKGNSYYEKVVERHKTNRKYVKGALIYRNKIQEPLKGQELLMEGWRSNIDATNCMSNYFANIPDVQELVREIDSVYKREVDQTNQRAFLESIKHQFDKHDEAKELTRDIAYKIISDEIKRNPVIASELRSFNKSDSVILKDILKFKQNNR